MKILISYLVSWWPDSMFAWYFLSSLLKWEKERFSNLLYVDWEKFENFIKNFSWWAIDQFIFHYNHKVRQESDQEAKFLKDFFQNKWYKVIIWENTNLNLTTEAELRQARWWWVKQQLENLLNKYDQIYIVTWHNLTDRIETTFLNMLRGVDLPWFVNMKFIDKFFLLPEKKVFVVRPLIDLPKDYIQNLCDEFTIPYFIDKTNFDPKISKRNKVRQIISELASMANVRKDGTNMFRKSWQNIYNRIGEVEVWREFWRDLRRKLELEEVYKEFWDKLGVNFIKKIEFRKSLRDLQIEDVGQLLKNLGIYQDITKQNLLELLKFFKFAKSGRKLFKWIYFYKTSGGIFVMDKKPLEGFTGQLIRKDGDYVIRYPKRGDKFGNKLLTKYLAKKWVPIFLRGRVEVKEKNWKIEEILFFD